MKTIPQKKEKNPNTINNKICLALKRTLVLWAVQNCVTAWEAPGPKAGLFIHVHCSPVKYLRLVWLGPLKEVPFVTIPTEI